MVSKTGSASPRRKDRPDTSLGFLSGGGEMGALMRSFDWSGSSLGPPAHWPQSLRTVVRLMLNTGHPMYIWWGPDLACLYNDAYRESIGPERHPGSLGRSAREVWEEVWDIIGPQIEHVLTGQGATWNVNHLVPITRHGRREDVYWTYSYSPIDDELAQSGVGGVLVVCSETTRQVQSAMRLEALSEELARSNRLKDEFLATLAHELRNPLAPIRNALALQRRAGGDPAILATSLEIMERQLAQMVRLIDDLLDLSRLSRGLVELRCEQVPLARVLADALETSRPLIDQHGHDLTIALPPGDLLVNVDPTRMVQVFANLLNNAAKFTPRGGQMRIQLVREGGNAVVSVSDNGVGIAQDMLGQVFDMFTQVERSYAAAAGGLGIGLTLVRKLVELHSGRVEARSAGRGQGSEFRVHLPLVEARSLPGPARRDLGARPRDAVPLRVVVADDNVDSARSLALTLELSGHRAIAAHDGERALVAARELEAEVMIVDVAMPMLDGHTVGRRARAEAWGRAALLIALSGWGQPEDRQRSRDAGFDHHLVKPVEVDALERLLAEHGKRLRGAT
jgi:signal transduction histidine kinase/CheY-like chemotaxis protein